MKIAVTQKKYKILKKKQDIIKLFHDGTQFQKLQSLNKDHGTLKKEIKNIFKNKKNTTGIKNITKIDLGKIKMVICKKNELTSTKYLKLVLVI